MKIFSQDLLMTMQHTDAIMVTITIVPKKYVGSNLEPAPDATVTLTADGYSQVDNTITVPAGTKVHCETTLTNYNTDTQDIVVYDDTSIDVRLNNRTEYLFTLTLTPSTIPFTLICLDENDVATGRTSATGSMYVPSGYKVRMELQNPDQFNAPANEYTWTITDTTAVARTLKASVTFGSIFPADSNHEFSIEDNQFTSPIYDNSVETQCTNRVYWKVNKPGYIEQTGTVNPLGAPNYFTNQTLSSISLQKKPLTFTVGVASPEGATITITVVSAGTGTSTTHVSTDTTFSVTCYVGDQVSYSVSKTGYETQSSYSATTMQSENVSVTGIRLTPLTTTVHIEASPAGSSVTLTDTTDGHTYTGTGVVEQEIMQDHIITYSATYGGVTVDGGPHTISSTDVANGSFVDYLYPVALDSSVTVITSTQTKTLEPGKYVYLLVGGGGGSAFGGGAQRNSSGTAVICGSGGGGGGAGYVKIGTFTISSASTALLTVGAGGSPMPTSGGVDTSGGASILTINNVEIARANGASQYSHPFGTDIPPGRAGRDGSCGGGPGALSVTLTGSDMSNPNYSYIKAGGRGGKSRSNGETVTRSHPTSVSMEGGYGISGTASSYASNAGAGASSGNYGMPGQGGTGLSSIQSTLTQPSYFKNLTSSSETTMYNSMSGGGGGGNGKWAFSTPTEAYRAGAGGGGGGWFNGGTPAWTGASYMNGAYGGAGAILYMRIAWS